MDKRKLKEYYNQKAKNLDEIRLTYKNSSLYKRFFFKTRFNKVVKALNPKKGERILDIGCGPGYYINYLVRRGCIVTGIDISDEYINQAKQFVKGARFLVGDAESLPFEDNFFDKVLMTEVIEHLPDGRKSLAEAKRVLKKGGVAVITTPNKYSYMNFAYSFKRKIRKYKFNEHIKEYSQEEFREFLANYFKIDKVYFSNFVIPYPLDNLIININSKGIIKSLSIIENVLSNSYILRNFGWTMIYEVRKI